MKSAAMDLGEWYLYLIRTNCGSLYTGIATNVARRFAQHQQGGARSSKYLRGRHPLILVYKVKIGARTDALRAENRLKRLSKLEKEKIVAEQPGRHALLVMLRDSQSANS